MKKIQNFRFLFPIVIITILSIIFITSSNARDFIETSINIFTSGDIDAMKVFLLSYGIWSPLISIFLMIMAVLIAPLPTFLITFANGLLFGTLFGSLLSWISALFGAIIAFYFARSLGRPVIEKFINVKALNWTDHFFKSYGIYAILLARVIPIASFGIVSYAAGLTKMRFKTYIIGTAIGQTPATILYSYLGENATDSVWILVISFLVVIAMIIVGSILKPKLEKRWREK